MKQLNVKLVAVGGASCAGKSTLADRLQSVLASCQSPHSVHVYVLKQDTFFKPTHLIPIDPITGEANWEVPEALDFDAMAHTFALIRAAQSLHELNALWKEKALGRDAQDHMRTAQAGHGHTNVPDWCPPTAQVESLLAHIQTQDPHRQQVVVLVDGFLLFHDLLVLNLFDVRMFLAADFSTCHKRRYARTGYACADGVFWQDPPGYFEQFVWPAYLQFNQPVLQSLPPAFSSSTLTPGGHQQHASDAAAAASNTTIAWRIEASFDCGGKADFLCIDSREAVAGRHVAFRDALAKVMEHIFVGC